MKITENVHRIDATPMSYVYVIQGEETVLIDTCVPFARKGLLRGLATLGIEPSGIRHILLTHYDIDHIGNAAILQEQSGAAVWASAGDIPYITGEKQRYGFKRYLGKLFRARPPRDIRPLPEGGVAGVQVIPTPGHTPGHVCFLYDGVLFAGDLLENKKKGLRPYPAAWDWDYARLLESVKEIGRYGFDLICPSHGQPVRREDAAEILG